MSAIAVADALNQERKVLVVDDEIDLVAQITRYLGRHGYSCESANNGGDALRIASADPDIAIVVTDVRMPGIDGLQLAESLRANFGKERQLQVIIMTGYAGLDHAIRAVHMGAHDFLTKPVSLKQMLETVKGADKAVRAARLDEQYKTLLRNEVAKRDEHVRRLTGRVQGLEVNAANSQDDGLSDVREVLLPGMVEELLPAIELAHGMATILREDTSRGDASGEDTDEDHVIDHLDVAIAEVWQGLQVAVDLMRVLTGDFELDKAPVALRDVLSEAVAKTRAEALGAGVGLAMPEDVGDIVMQGDAEWLTKALQLLVGTAVNLSPLGGVVRILVEKAASGATIGIEVDMGDDVSSTLDGHDDDETSSLVSSIHTSGLGYAFVRRLLPLMGGTLNFDQSERGLPSFRVHFSI